MKCNSNNLPSTSGRTDSIFHTAHVESISIDPFLKCNHTVSKMTLLFYLKKIILWCMFRQQNIVELIECNLYTYLYTYKYKQKSLNTGRSNCWVKALVICLFCQVIQYPVRNVNPRTYMGFDAKKRDSS